MKQRQLYAEIRRTSKYADQAAEGKLFPVFLADGPGWEYIVVGGPGERYRLKDVHLYVKHNGKATRIAWPGEELAMTTNTHA